MSKLFVMDIEHEIRVLLATWTTMDPLGSIVADRTARLMALFTPLREENARLTTRIDVVLADTKQELAARDADLVDLRAQLAGAQRERSDREGDLASIADCVSGAQTAGWSAGVIRDAINELVYVRRERDEAQEKIRGLLACKPAPTEAPRG